jgi:hypothetical protein
MKMRNELDCLSRLKCRGRRFFYFVWLPNSLAAGEIQNLPNNLVLAQKKCERGERKCG